MPSERKIAILVDSCSDIPQSYIEQYHMYVLPVRILFKDGDYIDRVTITPQQVYDRMAEEIPKTSLPSGEDVKEVFDRIVQDGYDTVLAIAISSGLSGTYNMLRIAAENEKRLEVYVLDTLNIGIGTGIEAIFAGRLIEQGLHLQDILHKLEVRINKTRVYFSLATLEYLSKGGRIGKVAAVLGSLLKIRPIITCNEDGEYVVASRVRGRSQSIAEMINIAVNEAKKYVSATIMVAHGSALQEAKDVLEQLRVRLPECKEFIMSELSPALGVHTGPGLVGISVHPHI